MVYVIPGHAATVGTDVDWNSAHIGTAVWRKLGGNYDIALVERSSTTRHINDSLPDLSNLPIGSPVTYPTVGSTVTAYGGTSKKQTGTIQETDFSWIVEGNLMTGMLRCSYRAIGGDSGAPVFGAAPVGIQSFSLFDTNGNWVTSAAMPLFIVCARLSQTHLFLQEF